MEREKQLGGLDCFRILAALFIVAIHTSPLASFNDNIDFMLTRIIARTAVPFFLMTTGYFLLPEYLYENSKDLQPLKRFLKKTLLLYGMGLLGDSYYGLIVNVPFIHHVYDTLFKVASYTRNGIFFAPVFLLSGAGIRYMGRNKRKWPTLAEFLVTFFLMLAEGLTLHWLDLQRHDSMYLMLPVCMFFLFQLLLGFNLPQKKSFRTFSMWLYLLHPWGIVLVRGAAGVMGMERIFVKNSLGHYLAVCVLSCGMAWIAGQLQRMVCEKKLYYKNLLLFSDKKSLAKGRAWIELDREALHQNVAALKTLLPSNCQLMPAVKAGAYGHGMIQVAGELQQLGVRAFCVASAVEGISLRENKIHGEILILGYTHPEQFPLLAKYHLTQTVVDFGYAKLLNAFGKKLQVHIKIDTGMHRLGERFEHLEEICNIFCCENLVITGIYTHLCAAGTDEPKDAEVTLQQGTAFYQVLSRLKSQGFDYGKAHLLASDGLLHYPELGGAYARVGIALYGVLSERSGLQRCPVLLRPVLSLKARIVQVKELYVGEGAGYGLQYVAKQNRKIAILSIGYADGIPRALSCGKGRVLIRGCFASIVGRICMDQMLVDITDIPGAVPGEEAVLIGKSGRQEITAYEIAEMTETITNEILSRMGSRLERIWR